MCDFFSGPTIGHYKGFTCEAFQGKLCSVWQSRRGTAVQVVGPSSWLHSHIFAFLPLPPVPSFLGPFIWLLQTLTLRPPSGGEERGILKTFSSLSPQYFSISSPNPFPPTHCRDSELLQQWDNPGTWVLADPPHGRAELSFFSVFSPLLTPSQ